MTLLIDELAPSARRVEVVERKGTGHPDTICDAVADHFERALGRYYRDRFGLILHHNVDKALLIGGSANPAFGGGTVDEQIEIVLSGRATSEFQGIEVPIAEIAENSVRGWLREHLHALDADRHISIRCAVRGGSSELTGLFSRSDRPLANDTSIGVGFWPLTSLEEQVLAIEGDLNDPRVKTNHPELGEDVKVLGVNIAGAMSFTVGCAMVDRHLASLDDYRDAKALVARRVEALVEGAEVVVNAGDDLERGQLFLTVTGTSAESGDDGEVGRGNRGNGLITPFRPMTLEAIAGKNPVTHVGKLYNIAATSLARDLVESLNEVQSAEVCLISRIGTPIDEPPVVWLGIDCGDKPAAELNRAMTEITRARLRGLLVIWEQLIDGTEAYW
jgi:S-adenosylmethionine synthetase